MGPIGKRAKLSVPQSVRDMTALLELINNPKQYEKFTKEIIKITDEANAATEKFTKVEEAQSFIVSANDRYEQAQEILDESNAKAGQTIAEATKQAKIILDKANAEANALIVKAETVSEEAAARESRSRDAMTVANELELRITAQEATFADREEKLKKAEAEVERKMHVLAQL